MRDSVQPKLSTNDRDVLANILRHVDSYRGVLAALQGPMDRRSSSVNNELDDLSNLVLDEAVKLQNSEAALKAVSALFSLHMSYASMRCSNKPQILAAFSIIEDNNRFLQRNAERLQDLGLYDCVSDSIKCFNDQTFMIGALYDLDKRYN